ncbi:M48 family metallopeptidase [Leptothoe spongobia]|uniref:M48 family metallopeptidase n=1 Tax=Leptothoe spongobia TAU-MAC 1115 TaxID=1967444 RepID=A0A947DIQ7_9CYAN|nr:M48 family metallopeptidase [Leptothoe spongobia]MBT9317977.1 M48 family metallopeptidase [Leptothoe spongobia TAU-MAC 1115]
MKYTPREIVDEVNITPVHPLVNFGYLLGTVVAAMVTVYVGLGVVGAQIAARLGPKNESRVGELVFESIFANMPLIEEGPKFDYTRALAESLRSDALKQRPDLKLHILDDPLPNAMVSAGGHVFVTTGLLEDVETENELAFVLAHELGHYEHRDNLRSLGRSLVFLSLNSTLAASGVKLPPFLMGSMSLADLHYSRDQEQKADVYAIEIMQERYGHLGSSLDFFERLSDWELDLGAVTQLLEWQSTHPLTQSRIEDLEEIATQRGWSLEGEATPLPSDF